MSLETQEQDTDGGSRSLASASLPAVPPARVIGLSSLDPWQARAADYWAKKGPGIWVRGGGKTFLAAHLIARSLVAGRPVLVIAPDERRLLPLQRELAALGLAEYHFLYDATAESRQELAKVFSTYRPVKSSAAGKYHPPKLAMLQREIALRRRQASSRAIFDRYPASVTVGLLLEARRKGGELLLDSQIGTEDFQFTGGEYFDLRDRLEQTQAIYQRLQLREAGLENLHTGIFLHQSEAESRQFITDHLERFSARARELYRNYLRETARFERLETQRLAGQAARLDFAVDAVGLALAEWSDSERVERGHRPAWQWFFLRRWGRAARREKERWSAVARCWNELRKQHQETNIFPVADWELPASATTLRTRLRGYREQLQAWRDRSDEWVRDELMRLNAGTVPTELISMRPALRNLEKGLERLVVAVNESGLYQLPLRADMLTSLRQRKFLESLLAQFEYTERHLAYYRDFYRWQRHWFGLPARLRRVTRRLLSLPGEDWPKLFSAWYFEQCLRRGDLCLPAAEAAEDGAATTETLRTAERARIEQAPWADRKVEKWTPVPTEDYKVFWRNRPRALQQRFPILLTTPEGATHLALGNVRCSDLIVETADALDPADWDYPADRVLVTAAESAPKGYTELPLNGLHRPGPLQALFAGGPISSSPGTVLPTTIDAAPATLLNEYRSRDQTAAAEQRIALTAFDPATLEVLRGVLPSTAHRRVAAPPELLGTAWDELIIYGPPPATGPSVGSSEILIDLLLSARERVTLVTSMAEKALSEALLTGGTSAQFVWAAAVLYLRYHASGEEEAAPAIAREVHTRLQRRLPGDHPLLREIAALLQTKDERLRFDFERPWRSGHLPAVASLPNGKDVVLIPAEGLGYDPPGSPEYEQYLARELKQAGFRLSYVDTAGWWSGPEDAARALLTAWRL